ncbi:MAG: PD40 domain-containing protein [Polyangiaceae bacterium]|nr:PD40 domain-containing protein [Polyangiaceae bacterium]
MNRVLSLSFAALSCGAVSLLATGASAQAADPPLDETKLGPFVVKSSDVGVHVTSLAILPSLSPDLEDVIVRGVVRRDMELSGMFRVIGDDKAPPGLYSFDDPVDVDEWKKVGAEVIVKVAARKTKAGKIEVMGLAYFLNVGKEPVYEKKLVVDPKDVRETAHRITDALLGAITGTDGGFASHMIFSGKWGKNRRIFSMDADGHDLKPRTTADDTALAPVWSPNALSFYYVLSKNYAPFKLYREDKPVKLNFDGSIYSVAFDKDGKKLAVAVSEGLKSVIYVGNPDGTEMKPVSKTELATRPIFSPTGKLAWVGGGVGKRSTRRIYVDGKAISPAGFVASAPTFCDTEDGVRIVYSVEVGGDRRDLVMSDEKGHGIVRLTQNMGSNTYPACSPDGRLLAFFSTRKKEKGIYMMNLQRWKTTKVSTQYGESLQWGPLPPPKVSFSGNIKKLRDAQKDQPKSDEPKKDEPKKDEPKSDEPARKTVPKKDI